MKTRPTTPKRVTGIQVPENKAQTTEKPASDSDDAVEEKIARLERELEEARLRADLYDEIINVAEKRFDIQIRKKAGTKR